MPKVSEVSLLVLLSTSWFVTTDGMEEDCVDFFGNTVSHGHFYIPGPSVCTLCVCYHSQRLQCKAIYCMPPMYCNKFRVGEKCCEFECLDAPEEIAAAKEKLRKRKKFLGIVYGRGNKVNPQLYLIPCLVYPLLWALAKV